MSGILRALTGMPDVYRDRWEKPPRGTYRGIYCVVDVPEDCPKPHKSRSDRGKRRTKL